MDGKTKINKLDVIAVIDDDVLKFQVSVNDVVFRGSKMDDGRTLSAYGVGDGNKHGNTSDREVLPSPLFCGIL